MYDAEFHVLAATMFSVVSGVLREQEQSLSACSVNELMYLLLHDKNNKKVEEIVG